MVGGVDKLSCYFFLDFIARQQRFDVCDGGYSWSYAR